jgi:uncharacterized protein YdiU (UPF0061 family)
MFELQNSYLKLPENFYVKVNPASFPSPSMIAFNHDLATEIGLDVRGMTEDELLQIFSGQKTIVKMPAIALAYAGFQFGHPNPQLGDGRAHLLGQSRGFDIQLKGSGPTPFSRGGDGKSALGPVLREFIVSEAMFALGVPTTRALCAVRTGEEVIRQGGPEPGGIFTRVAASHLRVGTFQFFSFKNDTKSVETLLNYTIERHYPELQELPVTEKAIELLKSLTTQQADLIAQWSALGFIHGVMNTDNFSMAGITIDYGPCAFMEEFAFQKVFSSIDSRGRYSYFNQVPMAKWNILRLAESLLTLIDDHQDKAIERIEKEVVPLFDSFEKKRAERLAQKLGIKDYQDSDEKLVMQFLLYLEDESLDFTLSFYHLPDLFSGDESFYKPGEKLKSFVEAWKARVSQLDDLKKINPLYIPRNHLIQRAIEHSYKGDDSYFHRLNEVLKNPWTQKEGAKEFSAPAKPDERINQTFCGT